MGDDKTYDRGLLVSPADAGKAMHILIQAARGEKTCELAAKLFVVCLGEKGEKGVLRTKLVLSGEYKGRDKDGVNNKMAMSPITVEQVRDMWNCADVEPWQARDIIKLPDGLNSKELANEVKKNPGLKEWVDVNSQMKHISTSRKMRSQLAEVRASYTDTELKKMRKAIEEQINKENEGTALEDSKEDKKGFKKKNCASAILVALNLFDPKVGQEKPANAALSEIAMCLIKRNYVNCEIKDSGGNLFETIKGEQNEEYKSVHNLSALDIFPGDKKLCGLQVMTTAAKVGAVSVLSELMDAEGSDFERVVGSKPLEDNNIHAHPLSEIGKPQRLLTTEEYDTMKTFVERCCDQWQNRKVFSPELENTLEPNGKMVCVPRDKGVRMVLEFMDECEPLFDCAKNGHAPLAALFIKRYKEALELLADDGAEDGEEEDKSRLSKWISQVKEVPNKINEVEKLTPLYFAISEGHFSVVRQVRSHEGGARGVRNERRIKHPSNAIITPPFAACFARRSLWRTAARSTRMPMKSASRTGGRQKMRATMSSKARSKILLPMTLKRRGILSGAAARCIPPLALVTGGQVMRRKKRR